MAKEKKKKAEKKVKTPIKIVRDTGSHKIPMNVPQIKRKK